MTESPMIVNMMKARAVPAESIESFLQMYCKPERYNAKRCRGYTEGLIEHNRANIVQFGYTFLSEHDSITGQVVSYFPCDN
jgi:hypothetical protein